MVYFWPTEYGSKLRQDLNKLYCIQVFI